MMIFLSKLLPVFVYPLGAAILLSIIVVAASFRRLRAIPQALLIIAVGGLWTSSTPVVANWLAGHLESIHPPVELAALPPAEVIVVLGGFVGQPIPPRLEPDLNDAVDRMMIARQLYLLGKAPNILVTGGNLPWQGSAAPEAVLISDLLVELGIPRDAILVETASRNTRENAVFTARVMQDRSLATGFLVTSGAHMPRALATFRGAGLVLVPVATDLRSRAALIESPLDLFPDAGALALSTAALKEWLGLVFYRLQGWA